MKLAWRCRIAQLDQSVKDLPGVDKHLHLPLLASCFHAPAKQCEHHGCGDGLLGKHRLQGLDSIIK